MRPVALILALTLSLITTACTEARMMTTHTNAPRIDKLFEKTKSVCFGRFVVNVPTDTVVVPGPQAFGANIQTIEGGAKNLAAITRKKRDEIVAAGKTIDKAEFRDLAKGPVQGSSILSFWESDSAKEAGLLSIYGYFATDAHAFVYPQKTSASQGRTEQVLQDRLKYIATRLRARAPDDIPAEPGVCLDLGFIADDTGSYQEIFGIGFRFPSLPDVSLSISSNKDGQTPEPLSKRRREAEKLALDSPLADAYRKVKVLREGTHRLYQWEGEEALFRRPREAGGVWHELRFSYPGIRYDRHNPRLDATLFTGVDRNTAGNLESSLTDEEVIALWDKILTTLRLRAVPR